MYLFTYDYYIMHSLSLIEFLLHKFSFIYTCEAHDQRCLYLWYDATILFLLGAFYTQPNQIINVEKATINNGIKPIGQY